MPLKIDLLNDSQRRITVVLYNGKILESDWFTDNERDKNENMVNCTKKENEVYMDLLQKYGVKEEDVKTWHLSRYKDANTIYISDHALERMRERNGWNQKTAIRMLQRIYNDGENALEAKGHVGAWINMVASGRRNDKYILFGDYVYVFSHTTLVTVLHVPPKHFKPHAHTKERKRDESRYNRSKEKKRHRQQILKEETDELLYYI